MILPILKFPDKRLQTKAAKVEAVDDNIQKMIKNMFDMFICFRHFIYFLNVYG
jgi:peptide deformylase